MSFTLSDAVNPPTVFFAKRSELGDRFDPEMVLFRRRANNFKYSAAKLKSFFSEPPQYGAGERGLEREDESQPRYIRITDIDEYGILTDDRGVTAANVESRYILAEDDLLIARSGNTVGKAYLHKKDYVPGVCFFAGYLIRFRFRQGEILPDYAFAFTQLPYYKEWVRAIQRAAGQPNINAREYSNLEIPAAPIPVQKKVVSLLVKAYAAKRRRDAEARKLLTTIDDVLLDELGISRQPEPPNTLESRIFKTLFSEVSGRRLNPEFHRAYFRQRHQQLDSCRYQNLLLHMLQGTVFQGVGRNIVEGSPITLLKVKNITTDGDIDFSETEPVGGVPGFKLLCPGDIVTPFIGAAIKLHKFAMFSGKPNAFAVDNNTGVIRISDNRIIKEYLLVYLRSELVRWQLDQLTGGGGVPFLGSEYAGRLRVIIPPRENQERVCQLVTSIRERARALREQARADLEKVKRDIEALILGKEGGK